MAFLGLAVVILGIETSLEPDLWNSVSDRPWRLLDRIVNNLDECFLSLRMQEFIDFRPVDDHITLVFAVLEDRANSLEDDDDVLHIDRRVQETGECTSPVQLLGRFGASDQSP